MSHCRRDTHEQTPLEQRANALTHGFGALLALAAALWMLQRAMLEGNGWHVATLAVFGSTLVAVYLASTLYHAFAASRWRPTLLLCDHICIYLLIAGTYTPFMLVTLGGTHGWAVFAGVWTLAALGVAMKLRFRERFHGIATVLYLLMGWLALLCASRVIEATSAPGLALLFAGGLAYTVGVGFYLWHRLPFNHALWHLFVIAGSACHVTAAFYDVLPGTAPIMAATG